MRPQNLPDTVNPNISHPCAVDAHIVRFLTAGNQMIVNMFRV